MSRLLLRHLLPGVRSGASHPFAAAATSHSASFRAASSRSLYTSRLAPPAYHTSATATAAAAGTQSKGAAAAAAAAESTPATGDQPSPMPSPAARGRWAGSPLKFGALAAVAGAIGGVGYASYAYSLNEVAEKTREFRKKPALLIPEDASTFEKYKAMVYLTAMKVSVSAIELYLDIRSTEDHVEGFTEPTSDKLLLNLLPQDQHAYSNWQLNTFTISSAVIVQSTNRMSAFVNGQKRAYSSKKPEHSKAKDIVQRINSSIRAGVPKISRWIFGYLCLAVREVGRLAYRGVTIIVHDMCSAGVVLGIIYAAVYLSEKVSVFYGDSTKEEMCSADSNAEDTFCFFWARAGLTESIEENESSDGGVNGPGQRSISYSQSHSQQAQPNGRICRQGTEGIG